MEFVVEQKELPIIKANFSDVKAGLEAQLKNYEGLVVTEDTLSACKDAQKELASLRVKVDGYRKDIKKDLSAPIVEFENKCKELISMIEKTEAPIKEGIKYFDDIRREEKRQKALEIIKETAIEQGLNEEFSAMLVVEDKYLNLTAKVSDVKDDVTAKAFALKIAQDKKREMLDSIQSLIDIENERINNKMCLKDFEYEIKTERPLPEMMKSIKAMADRIYASEHPAPKEEVKEEVKEVKPSTTEDVKKYVGHYDIIGTADELLAVTEFLKANGYSFKAKAERC